MHKYCKTNSRGAAESIWVDIRESYYIDDWSWAPWTLHWTVVWCDVGIIIDWGLAIGQSCVGNIVAITELQSCVGACINRSRRRVSEVEDVVNSGSESVVITDDGFSKVNEIQDYRSALLNEQNMKNNDQKKTLSPECHSWINNLYIISAIDLQNWINNLFYQRSRFQWNS